MIARLKTFIDTLKYLTFGQMVAKGFLLLRTRLVYKIPGFISIYYSPERRCKDWNETNPLNWGSVDYQLSFQRTDRIQILNHSQFQFRFNNQTRIFSRPINWAPSDTSFLWRYNLHYFDYGYDLAVEYLNSKNPYTYHAFQTLVSDWIDQNPVNESIGWEPYPTSLRIVNWIKAYFAFEEWIIRDEEFRNKLFRSLCQQSLFLMDNVEYHLLNNHMLENGRALLAAGLFFRHKKAKTWADNGWNLLSKELKSQVHNDGGQFELSPMYHAVVTLIYLDVLFLLKDDDKRISTIKPVIEKMARFYAAMIMPNREIAYLNDAAAGMTIDPLKVLEAFRIAGFKQFQKGARCLETFPDSGLYVFSDSKNQSKCIFDCGPIGPDFQPGHGHSDTLSFVWAYRGQKVIVDSGVDDYYKGSSKRAYYRSTRAHNTVSVDRKDQSDMWGNFRVGRRAHPIFYGSGQTSDYAYVIAGHDGYYNHKNQISHTREFYYLNDDVIVVWDKILGKGKHQIDSYLHFHPEYKISVNEESMLSAISKNQGSDIYIKSFEVNHDFQIECGRENLDQGWYCSQYGNPESNDVIIFFSHSVLPTCLGYCLFPSDKFDYHDIECRYDDECGVVKVRVLDKTHLLFPV